MSSVQTFELVAGVEASLESVEDGIRVTVAETHDGYHVIYSSVESRDFFSSTQKRATIANRIEEQVSGELNAPAVKKEFEQLCSRIDAGAIDEDKKNLIRPPVVRRLLDETLDVEGFLGESASVTVTLSSNGREASITFTSGEWVARNPAPLKQRYFERFFEKLDIDADAWEELTEEWQAIARIGGYEEMTAMDALVEDVISGLKQRVNPVADREVLWNGTYTAWFDDSNGYMDGDVPEGTDVLWIRSSAVTDQIQDAGKSADMISEVSKALKDAEYTFHTSKKKKGERAYPFDPEKLGITEWDVFDEEEAVDQSEVSP